MKRFAAPLSALTPLLAAQAAAAAIVFDNGSPDYAASARGLSDTAPFSEAANDLPAFAADTAVTQVRFWGGYTGAVPASDAFTVRLYGAFSGYMTADFVGAVAPQALVRSGQPTGSLDWFDALGNPVVVGLYEYLATVSFTLDGGEAYALSIQNDTAGTEGSWLWAFSSETLETGAIRSSTQSWWQPVYGTYAFQLIGPDEPAGGTVPAPGTLALAALGLAGIARLRPRTRR